MHERVQYGALHLWLIAYAPVVLPQGTSEVEVQQTSSPSWQKQSQTTTITGESHPPKHGFLTFTSPMVVDAGREGNSMLFPCHLATSVQDPANAPAVTLALLGELVASAALAPAFGSSWLGFEAGTAARVPASAGGGAVALTSSVPDEWGVFSSRARSRSLIV